MRSMLKYCNHDNFLNFHRLGCNKNSLNTYFILSRQMQISFNKQKIIAFNYSTENKNKNYKKLQKTDKQPLSQILKNSQPLQTLKKQSNLIYKLGIIAILSYLTCLTYILYGQQVYQNILTERKYRVLSEPNYNKKMYIQGSFLEKELERLIKTTFQNKIKIIEGLHGVGKTYSINFLMQKMRSQGQTVYYINLRDIFLATPYSSQKFKLQIQKLFSVVLRKWPDKKRLQYKKIKLIIDNIHQLQIFQNQDQLQSILTGIESFNLRKNVDMICISSKRSFVDKLKNISSFNKAAQFFFIQHQTGQNYKKFIEKVIIKHHPTISQEAKNYMISKQYSLINIVQNIREFISYKQPTTTQLSHMQKQDKYQFVNAFNFSNDVFKQIDNTQLALMLFDQIINSPQQLSIQNCTNIKKKVNQKFGLYKSTVKEALQKLQKKYLTVYCKPTQMIFKEALKKNYQQQKEAWKQTK